MWIDVFVLLPLIVVQFLVEALSKTAMGITSAVAAVAYVAYSIYFHGRFGQTIGKRVMGIRVVRLTGERITWREAWLRSSVDLLVSPLGIIGTFMALAAIPNADYYGVGWMQRAQNLAVFEPRWLSWTGTAMQVWVWSEVIVMLFNKRRRALHDFIAGTVVVSEQRVADRAGMW